MTNSIPFFSIITPAYNAENFIERTLESVRAQTWKDFEWVIVDDGSPDRTGEIIENWIHENPDFPITFFRQNNQKVAAARNRAIENSKGKYLAFLDADDEWDNSKLEVVYQEIKRNPGYEIFCHDAFAKTYDGKSHYHKCGPGRSFNDLLFEGNPFVTSGTIVLSEKVTALGGFISDLKFNGVEDYDLWMRLIEAGARVKYIPQALSVYNVVPGSLSQQLENQSGRELDLLKMHFDQIENTSLWIHCKIRMAFAKINMGVARRMHLKGEYKPAKEYYRRVLGWNPIWPKVWVLMLFCVLGKKASFLSYFLPDLLGKFKKYGSGSK